MDKIEVKAGDLIELGNHRLVCGDASKPEHLRVLFAGNEKVDMICADAPYGVGYVEGKKDLMEKAHGKTGNIGKFKPIANDGVIQDYYAFSKGWLEPIIPYLNTKNTYYLFNGDSKAREFLMALHDLKYTHSQIIIWNKNQVVMGRKDYQPMHELIFYGWHGRHKYFGGKDKSILTCPKPKANVLHPTMKPPQLLRKLIAHATERNMIVYDAFGGSGSTLIACEQIGRACRMVEIESSYCETIIQRYIKLCKSINREAVVKLNGVNQSLSPIQ